MVGEPSDGDPLTPTLGGSPHLLRCLVECRRGGQMGPRERHEYVVTLGHTGTSTSFSALDADTKIGRQSQRRLVSVGTGLAGCCCLLVDLAGVLPLRGSTVVVERRLAAHLQFDRAADTFAPACVTGNADRCCATDPLPMHRVRRANRFRSATSSRRSSRRADSVGPPGRIGRTGRPENGRRYGRVPHRTRSVSRGVGCTATPPNRSWP